MTTWWQIAAIVIPGVIAFAALFLAAGFLVEEAIMRWKRRKSQPPAELIGEGMIMHFGVQEGSRFRDVDLPPVFIPASNWRFRVDSLGPRLESLGLISSPVATEPMDVSHFRLTDVAGRTLWRWAPISFSSPGGLRLLPGNSITFHPDRITIAISEP